MSEDTMLDQAIKDIVNVMTSLAGLKSILEDRREPEDGEVLDQLIKDNNIDVDELNKEFPPEQYTDGHVIEAIRERLDKPEEGKVYSLLELSKTKKWSESEVEPYTQEIDVFDIDYDEEDLFADIK